MKQFVFKENVDRRVLAAVRFTNAVDGTPVFGPLNLRGVTRPAGAAVAANDALPIRVVRGRSGLHVIDAARGFDDYVNRFAPEPEDPAFESKAARLRIEDPSGRFLPAEFTLRLPRSLNPSDAPAAQVRTPLEIALFPSPSAAVASSWTALRVLVWREVAAPTPQDPEATRRVPVRGALVRVSRTVTGDPPGREFIGRGLTEWRRRADGSRPDAAEALVGVRGLAVTTWNADPGGGVVSVEHAVTIEVTFDPAANVDDPAWLPDVPRLEAGGEGTLRGALPGTIPLRARVERNLGLVFDLENNLVQAGPGTI